MICSILLIIQQEESMYKVSIINLNKILTGFLIYDFLIYFAKNADIDLSMMRNCVVNQRNHQCMLCRFGFLLSLCVVFNEFHNIEHF